jgi:hypothetical protein
MKIYSENDENILQEKMDTILQNIKIFKKGNCLDISDTDIENIENIIINYIKQKKRKIYGGYAMNILIKEKNKKEAFYEEPICLNDPLPDIDLYSPDPIKDIIEICNLLADKGYINVRASEAIHGDTYNISIDKQIYSQISYIPSNIYNKLPFIELNGIYIINPVIYKIDFFRMMVDPLQSYWRIEKQFKRFNIIEKYYPLSKNIKQIKLEKNKYIHKFSNSILSFLENNNEIITVGFYSYNYYLLYANKNNFIDIPYYEVVSTNYIQTCMTLYNILKEIDNDIEVIEHYPFFQFIGFSAYFFYKNQLICIIYDYYKICLPYLNKKSYNFSENKYNEKTINISTFSLFVGFTLRRAIYGRVMEDVILKENSFSMVSHIIELRNEYYKKENKNIFDETIFQDFIINCIGKPLDVYKEKKEKIEERKRNKMKYTFNYDPSTDKNKNREIYNFANSSGNKINNPKNLKLNI